MRRGKRRSWKGTVRLSYEERVSQIKDLASQGLNTREIAERLHLPISKIHVITKQAEITVPVSFSSPELEGIISDLKQNVPEFEGMRSGEKLELLIGLGITNYDDLATAVEIKRSTALTITSRDGMSETRKIMLAERRKAMMKSPDEYGINSIEELLDRMGMNWSYAYQFSKEHGIPYPTGLAPHRCWPEVDAHISKMTYQQIGDLVGVSRERVRQYLVATNQLDKEKSFMKNRSRDRLAKQASIEKLASGLLGHLLERAENEAGLPLRKALEYRQGLKAEKPNSIPIETLEKMFSEYYATIAKGQKSSMQELSLQSGISGDAAVSHILKRVGLNPMYGTWERHITPNWKKHAARRATKTFFSVQDIAHFLRVENYTFAYLDFRTTGKESPLGRFQRGYRQGAFYMSHARISDVYEAQDIGFNVDETAEVLGITPKAVNAAIKGRDVFAPIIVKGLRTMFADSSIDKPYLPDSIRERLRTES
jgi:predicted transcriptional regulator